MIGLYLLASHMAGDFLLQSRWQAAAKLRFASVRAQHVAWYTAAFVPVVFLTVGWRDACAFLSILAALHFATDSHRLHSTLGDVIQWRRDLRADPVACKQEWLLYVYGRADGSVRAFDVSDEAVRWPTPNPWPPTSLMVDQSLHLIQLAVLGAVFLT